MGFSRGLKKEFETAMVNEPSVFEPLKFYCIFVSLHMSFIQYRVTFEWQSGCSFELSIGFMLFPKSATCIFIFDTENINIDSL